MQAVSLRALSVGYLAAQRLALTPNGRLRLHSTFRQTLNLQLDDGRLLPLISANSSLNHPDAVRVAVPESWDWRTVAEINFEYGILRGQHWQIALADAPVWSPERPFAPTDLSDKIALLESELRTWCQQQQVDSVLRLLPDDAFGVEVKISAGDSDEQLAEIAARIIGFGGGLTPDGDDYLLGYFAALSTTVHPLVVRHCKHLAAVIEPRLTRTNDISRHYLSRAIQGHFSQALCRLIAQLSAPFCTQTLQERATRVMAFGAASGADCMAGFLHGLRNLNALTQ